MSPGPKLAASNGVPMRNLLISHRPLRLGSLESNDINLDSRPQLQNDFKHGYLLLGAMLSPTTSDEVRAAGCYIRKQGTIGTDQKNGLPVSMLTSPPLPINSKNGICMTKGQRTAAIKYTSTLGSHMPFLLSDRWGQIGPDEPVVARPKRLPWHRRKLLQLRAIDDRHLASHHPLLNRLVATDTQDPGGRHRTA